MSEVSEVLPPEARPLFSAPVFVSMTTINPDGAPQSSVVWARLDGEQILISTIHGRRKYLNLVRDPRVTLLAFDPEDPYFYVEVRGAVELTEEGGPELINELSQAYMGEPFGERPAETRVVVRVTPRKVIAHVGPQSRRRRAG
ncbi:PPOX class probable F420-dependent enzyme [Herbihabitans rhizosphaerae]|uniref:PPOX class probable F420-dependent enzyme n=1 Tax=Herbihabitans rhizosphaerae TaxID=1872711 RepID=A0A4Q7KGB6_9PSEU|nr:PPOX class F420-dependent oxidoreductase [Herbihabitans rhizosphaerae]RZS33891.1 PPOX class probable F420-dependent enzyme [Herbihabitans rhizosphaerae]